MPSDTPHLDGAIGTTAESESEIAVRTRQELITGRPPRIPPLPPSELGAEAHEMAERTRQAAAMAMGRPAPASRSDADEVPEMIAIMLRHPELYRSHLTFGIQLLAKGALPARVRELAILRTGWLCKAPYEWGEHVRIGGRIGLTREEFECIIHGSTAPGWNEHDRAVLRAVEELHTDAMISDETWAVLARTLDEKQLIELPILVGQYHTLAYSQNTLRLRLRSDNQGLLAR